MPDYELTGKTALVTGASGGLGGAISERLVDEGANVVCADIVEASETVKAMEESAGKRVMFHQIDMSESVAVGVMTDSILDNFGSLDIVVNAAAILGPYGEVADITDEEIDAILRNNLVSTIVSCRAAARIMMKQQSGVIINIASQNGKVAWPNVGVYSVSKAGVVAPSQALALELAKHNVRVTAIAPGTMDAPMMYDAFGQMSEQMDRDRDEMIQEFTEAMPFGRLGAGRDIASMVAWLASPESVWTVGTALNLSGGENVAY
jgi:NAD(P)-dependent dehydrogenase (short-subunit alcohol dehydrogenase family)